MRGFWVVLAVGLALLVLAAWRDRQTRLRARHALGLPETPRRAPAQVASEDHRAWLADFRVAHSRLDLSLADESFATWADPATLELADAVVLSCPEGVGQQRELLPSLAAARSGNHPLVVACSSIDEQTLALLAGAPRTAAAPVAVLMGSAEACSTLASTSGGSVATRGDLQSGWAVHTHGLVRRVVADAEGCWVEAREA